MPPLCVERLETHGCRQTAAAALKPAGGEQLDFENFASDARIDLSLAQRPTEVQAVAATATVLGQGKMSSRVAADFRTALGPVFSLKADVLPNWTIDSVQSQPADALDDWTLDRSGGGSKLSIRLARPLSSSRPLRLVVLARRLYAVPGRNLGIDDVVPLRFSGLSESKQWVDLRASAPNELRLSGGDRLRRVEAKDLTASDLDLFSEPPGDVLFRDDAGAFRIAAFPGAPPPDLLGRRPRRGRGERRRPGGELHLHLHSLQVGPHRSRGHTLLRASPRAAKLVGGGYGR